MLRVKYPIVVEGRYDKSRLASLVDAQIITTDGFGIFGDPAKLHLLQQLARQDKLILLTDSDRAGFRIRAHIAGAIPPDRLVQIYIPEVVGKESRKERPSAEGTLGVEGIDAETLRQAFAQAGVLAYEDEPEQHPAITRAQLYALGLSGSPHSATLRRQLLLRLGLPQKLSSNALCGVLPRLISLPQLEALLDELKGGDLP